jgi:hypothetical protein
VGQGVLLQAATAAGQIWRGGFMPASLPVLFNAYHEVLAYQVSEEQSAQRLPALLQARRLLQVVHSGVALDTINHLPACKVRFTTGLKALCQALCHIEGGVSPKPWGISMKQ